MSVRQVELLSARDFSANFTYVIAGGGILPILAMKVPAWASSHAGPAHKQRQALSMFAHSSRQFSCVTWRRPDFLITNQDKTPFPHFHQQSIQRHVHTSAQRVPGFSCEIKATCTSRRISVHEKTIPCSSQPWLNSCPFHP